MQDLAADCGRPAFFEDHRGFALEFEHEVDWLEKSRCQAVRAATDRPRAAMIDGESPLPLLDLRVAEQERRHDRISSHAASVGDPSASRAP